MFKKNLIWGMPILALIIVTICVFVILGSTQENYALDSVSVYIKAEFEQEFENEEFTIEDFTWGNVESIVYIAWFTNASEPYGYLSIHLIEHGKNEVLDAIEHFKTLNFVKDAKTNDFGSWH